MNGTSQFRIGIDVGGTFTDLAILELETGQTRVTKAPSTPSNPIAGVMEVIEKTGVPSTAVRELIHGTTVATNALLERKKGTPGLITTKGFRDIVFIQRGNRRYHYDLRWSKPKPYVERRHCLEVEERTNYRGEVVMPLDESEARRAVRALASEGIRDIAVSFLFSFVTPKNELRMREIIEEEYPEARVSLSHEVYPRWREFDRTSTTLADAFVKSLVQDYVDNLAGGLRQAGMTGNFLIMKSNGGIEDHQAAAAKPIDLLVSGPVGGVLSAIFFGQLTGRSNLISMDMGGTSFDVSLIQDGQARRTVEVEIEWGLPVYTPMVDVKTIGAGGGSIAWIDKGGLLRVGPQSAGADPGPACYDRGGTEATVTDANLVLGRLNPDYFLGGDMALNEEAAHAAVQRLGSLLGMDVEETAASILDLVNFNMVNAIRLVSIDRGLDPRDFTLVSFGGAGSLHAGALSEIIGIRDVLVPLHQGAFSAFGLMTADMRVDESTTASLRSDTLSVERINDIFDRLVARTAERMRAEGYPGEPTFDRTIEMRYMGQNYGTEISVPPLAGPMMKQDVSHVIDRFHAEHARLYGYDIPDEVVEFVHFNVTALGPIEKPTLPRWRPTAGLLAPKSTRAVYFRSVRGRVPTPIYERESVPAGASIQGPAVVEEPMSTTLVHPGHTLECDPFGNFTLRVPSVR
jgi:N-methylhydantoinase A